MSINLINPPEEEKINKSYFITQGLIDRIENLRKGTNSKDNLTLFEKMVSLSENKLAEELKAKSEIKIFKNPK